MTKRGTKGTYKNLYITSMYHQLGLKLGGPLMNKLKIKNRIRVRLRQQSLSHNISKERTWLKASQDEMREELHLPNDLCWYDIGNPVLSIIDKIKQIPTFYHQPFEVPEMLDGTDEENVKLFVRGKLDEIPLTDKVYNKVDLAVAQTQVPCFGMQYRKCTMRKQCHLAGLCKQESSKLRAHEKAGTAETYVQVRENIVKGKDSIRKDMTLENATKEQIDRWMRSDRLQYYRYLKHMVFNEEERLALDAATYYETRVKKIIRKPFYVVLGKSGDVTQHKNWAAFLRVAKRAIEHNASIDQYLEAQFHYSHSKTGYPPLNSLGSANAGKRYDDYVKDVIKKDGTKMVKVWETKDEFYKMEQDLQMMWYKVLSQNAHLFPSKDFYLFHGMHMGLGRTQHFTEEYLRKKYPDSLYKEVEGRYEDVLNAMKSSLPKIYVMDMNKPALFTNIYQS